MTNMTQEFNLELSSIPIVLVNDVLRGLLHSIIFHRLLVHVVPRELRVLNTSISITDSPDIENLIEEKIVDYLNSVQHPSATATSSSSIAAAVSPSSTSQSKQQGKITKRVAILFYEKRLRKNWFQFSKSEEFVCWEQWTITLHLINDNTTVAAEQEQAKLVKSVEYQFKQSLLKILKIVNGHKEHIPSITTTEGNPFPYQIAIQSNTESWSSMMKRLHIADVPTIERSSLSTKKPHHHQPIPNALPNASSSSTTHNQSSSRPPSLRSIKRYSLDGL
ncbi:hypothetical protein BDF20DRAFT_915413 [Mycotypha africana]|uniref:uncharacterized protein n=1 Tax=Mycotypha africana TaxID=64632 RepID=UPI0023005E08|nr:uncharacterized protein BDF20DRAFT_915413 [Mycotypha africana]KAI8971632.1 hypothetical protein BDF20DRAFT_915413 [Mycotypha africana]